MASSSSARIAMYQQMLQPLRSREQVLVTERADARSAVEAAQRRLKLVDAEMEDVAARIGDLEDSIARAYSGLEPHVMENLPAELLRAVFLELADEIHRTWTWDDKNLQYMVPKVVVPFVLAAVCRRWRLLALDTSSLWSYITVPLPSSEDDAEKALRYVRTLAGRSGSSPIDCCVTWLTPVWQTSMSDACDSILAILSNLAPRWRRISVDVGGDADIAVFDLFRRPTPLLEEISVWVRTIQFQTILIIPDPALPRYLPLCPRLRRFRTGRCNVIFSAPQHSLAHLTYIQIWSDLSASAVWEALSLVPALEHLDLWLQSGLGSLAPSPGSHLELPALQRLDCCHFAIDLFDHWAAFLRAPRLRHLELEFIGESEDATTTMENLVRQTSSSVVSLCITDYTMAATRAGELAALSNLRTVDLHGWFSPEFFLRLVEDRACPRLQAMNIDPSDNEDFRDVASAILKFVRSRTVDIDALPQDGVPGQLTRLRTFSIVDTGIPKWLPEQIAPYMMHQ